jgi:hypothetical protein
MVKCGLVVLLLANGAFAAPAPVSGEPVRIELTGATTFTAREVSEALAARLPPDAPHGVLQVVARADGAIELSWESRRRVVDLGGESGPTAARVVALLAADLLLPLGLPPLATEAPRPLGPGPSPPGVTRESEARVALRYQAWSGVAAGPYLQGLELAAGLDHRHLRLLASAGYLSGPGNPMVGLTAWPLRLGAGAGLSFGSLIGSLVMIPYQLDDLVHLQRSLVGLGLETQLRLPVGGGFAVEAGAGYEVYVNRRLEIWAGTVRLFTMPTSSFRISLGLSWGRPR